MALKPRGGFGRGRRLAEVAEGLGTAVVILLLLAAILYAASRPALRWRWDLTEGAQYTLTEQTRKILENLEEPLVVTTLFRPEPQVIPNGLFEIQARATDYVCNLLQEYVVSAGGRLSVRHLDAAADRAEADALVREHNLARYNVVLVRRGARVRQVYLEELVTIDRGLANPEDIRPAELREYHAERPLTSALLSLASQTSPRVGFLMGHGETALDDLDVSGLGLLAQALRGQGMTVEPLDLTTVERVPEGLEVLAVVGPQRPLGGQTTAALEAFHESGGALLLALDPWLLDPETDALLARIGLLRERAIATLESPLVQGPRRAVLAVRSFEPDHAISAPIARQGLFAILAPSGGLARAPGSPPSVRTVALAITDKEVFGDLPPGDWVFDAAAERRAPRAVAFAVEGGPGQAVVFGGAGFLSNSFLSASEGGPGNMDLALNALNWLVERDYAVDARPREVFEARVELYDDERREVFLYVVILMPLGGALLGAAVWFLRRR